MKRLIKMLYKTNYSGFAKARHFCKANNLHSPWSIHFYGNDNFSLASLKALHEADRTIVSKLEVITNTVKNPVGKFAQQNGLPIHYWPINTDKVAMSHFNIGIVVSFGYLIPKELIDIYPLGMLNVHASLLPKWRGASPIVHAIANGDTETGISIMKIQPERFDVGDVLKQKTIAIPSDKKMPLLYDELAQLGAQCLIETMKELPGVLHGGVPQNEEKLVTYAPKVKPTMANVDLDTMTVKRIYDLGRALSGEHPLNVRFRDQMVKLHSICGYEELEPQNQKENIVFDKKNNTLKFLCKNGWILVDKIQVPGKKVVTATEFKNGYLKNKG